MVLRYFKAFILNEWEVRSHMIIPPVSYSHGLVNTTSYYKHTLSVYLWQFFCKFLAFDMQKITQKWNARQLTRTT